MKDNIDLTMDNDFTKPVEQDKYIEGTIKSLDELMLGKPKFQLKDTLDYLYGAYEFEIRDLFFTGNKKEREQKYFYSEWGNTCERCGVKLDYIPWKEKECGTLCCKCDEELENNYGRIPWRQR